MTEREGTSLYIGSRVAQFRAAAACLSLGPKLREAGIYCMWLGGFAVLYLIGHSGMYSLTGLEFLALFAFGGYLFSPAPEPAALPIAGAVILVMLANELHHEYLAWRPSHAVIPFNPVFVLVEVGLAVSLFASYYTYRKKLAETDEGTLNELRALATGVNKADLAEDANIAELSSQKRRLRLCGRDNLIILVGRHYIGFHWYSKLDSVALVEPQSLSI